MERALRLRLPGTSLGIPPARTRAIGAGLLLLALLAACHRSGGRDRPDGAPPASASNAPGVAPSGSGSSGAALDAGADADAPDGEPGWRRAVRQRDWRRALTLLRELPDADRQSPVMRLVLGRVALEAGEWAEAVTALRGLGTELPSVRAEAELWYAQAAAVAGPLEEAAAFLARSTRVEDLITAAEAYLRAGKTTIARNTIDTAVARAERLRHGDDETRARMARAAMAEQAGQTTVALVDWRWVVSSRPSDPAAREALGGLARIKAAVSLDAELTALTETTTSANVDATLERIAELAKARPGERVLCALGRARALMHARRNAQALEAFDEAAKLVSPYRPEALYFAARSAVRAGDVDGALARYRTVSLGPGTSAWAERASQQYAQLLLQAGRFPEAAAAFSQHLARYRRGKELLGARHAYALALLGAGKAKQAKESLFALRQDKASAPGYQSQLRELEGVAALRAGDRAGAVQIWLGLLHDEPLTFPALAAHARLASLGHTPLPPLMAASAAGERPPLPVTLPAGPALLHDLGLDDSAERRLGALEDEIAARYPGRESEALCALYGQLSNARRRMQIGNRATSYELLMRSPSAQERWAWACVYPEPYRDELRAAEARFSLPLGLGHAIMRQESAFRVDAESDAGALGLMQLMPDTAAKLGHELGRELGPGDLLRPDVNIELGTSYLGKLLKGFRGSVPLTAAGYNAGPQAVRTWLRCPSEREVDLWVARIPYGETRDYVVRVVGNLARYQYLAGGPAAVEPLGLQLPAEVDVGDDAY